VDVDLDAPSGPPPGWALGLLGDADLWSRLRVRVASSSVALGWVAAGRRAAYVTGGDVASVHFAAGVAVCAAAGCVVTDLTGDPPGTGDGLVAACDVVTSALLLDLLARHR
jgi:myo-inositol-1(or 4)-monophosphatase